MVLLYEGRYRMCNRLSPLRWREGASNAVAAQPGKRRIHLPHRTRYLTGSVKGNLIMTIRLPATILTLGLAVIFSTGCANTVDPVYPVSTGSHSKIEQVSPDRPRKAVVWGNHPIVVNAVIQAMQETNVRVVERARLKEIMNEQKIRLTNAPDGEADLLKVGRLLGVDWIVFADATVHSAEDRRTPGDASGGGSQAQPVYHLSVSVRNVSIETGEIRWSGTATYPAPVTNPDQALISLTRMAISHAVCPLENGYTWDERAGCRRPK